jgi:hypothetical protein
MSSAKKIKETTNMKGKSSVIQAGHSLTFSGVLINRFSKDTLFCDERLSNVFTQFANMLTAFLGECPKIHSIFSNRLQIYHQP